MSEPRAWIADDLAESDYDPPAMDRGDSYDVTRREWIVPGVVHPIGFMRRKPRVRVKAWTMPIIAVGQP